MYLFHVTTEKKAKAYRDSGSIHSPVRGFDSLPAAMFWAMKTGRKVIYRIECSESETYKLPDHHNDFGTAFWTEFKIPYERITCVVSAT
jgi:hypothetical protein